MLERCAQRNVRKRPGCVLRRLGVMPHTPRTTMRRSTSVSRRRTDSNDEVMRANMVGCGLKIALESADDRTGKASCRVPVNAAKGNLVWLRARLVERTLSRRATAVTEVFLTHDSFHDADRGADVRPLG